MKNRSMQSRSKLWIVAIAVAASVVGANAASPALDKAVVSDEPTSKGLGVIEAKAKTKDAEKIVVQGRVKDLVEGQAVFTIADSSMKSCKDNGEDCPTPWDFCCETKETITKNTATVKVVEADGKKALKESVKGVKGLTNLTPVTVEGIAQKDKAGNLVVLAEKVYVKQ